MRKQTTFTVKGKKIKIVSRPKLSAGNLVGWTVKINDQSYFRNCLTRKEAMDSAYGQYVKENK